MSHDEFGYDDIYSNVIYGNIEDDHQLRLNDNIYYDCVPPSGRSYLPEVKMMCKDRQCEYKKQTTPDHSCKESAPNRSGEASMLKRPVVNNYYLGANHAYGRPEFGTSKYPNVKYVGDPNAPYWNTEKLATPPTTSNTAPNVATKTNFVENNKLLLVFIFMVFVFVCFYYWRSMNDIKEQLNVLKSLITNKFQ
jgi:hypothetical protein